MLGCMKKCVKELYSGEVKKIERSLFKQRTLSKMSKIESKSESNEKQVVIMFLAHDGVKQPDMWEAWRKTCQKQVQFIVHANPDTDDKNAFAKQYGIFPTSKRVYPTRWADPSLVFATQVLIREAVARFPKAEMFYLVSGADIPIRPVEFLLKLETVCRMQCLPGKTVFSKLKKQEQKQIVPTKKWRISDFIEHPQWIALNHIGAQTIASFDFTLFNVCTKFIAEYQERTGEQLAVPDEYYIGSALKHTFRVKKINWTKNVNCDSLLVLALREKETDASPLNWDSLKQKQKVWFQSKKITLQQAIEIALTSEDEPNHVFFRKVASSSQLDLHGLFSWY